MKTLSLTSLAWALTLLSPNASQATQCVGPLQSLKIFNPGWDSEQKLLSDAFVEFMKDATVTELSIQEQERGGPLNIQWTVGHDRETGNESVTLVFDAYFPFLMAEAEIWRAWLPTHLTLTAVKKYDSQCNVIQPEQGKDYLTVATKLRDKNFLSALPFFREELLTSFPYGTLGGAREPSVAADVDRLSDDLGARLLDYATQGHSSALPSRGRLDVTFAPVEKNDCSVDVTFSLLDWKTSKMKRVEASSGDRSLTARQEEERQRVIAHNNRAKLKTWLHNLFKPKARDREAQVQPVTSKREYACRNAFDIAVRNARAAMAQ